MFLHTFLLVFIAEMADKTQLMIMALTNRYRVKTVVIGMFLGVLIISALSVLAGDLIGDFIPMKMVKIIAALMFIFFGLTNLKVGHDEEHKHKKTMRFPIVSIAFTFLIAELGDKTQLATVALAADHMGEHIPIFLGASLGLILANILGIFAGKFIFSKFSEDSVKIASSFFFFLFGSITLFEVIPGSELIILIYSTLLIGMAYIIYMKSRKQKIM